MSVKIGIQLYTVRDHAEKDPEGTIRKIAEYGYQGVQFAGYYGYKAEELKKLLDSVGLVAAGSHVGYDLFLKDPEGQLAYAKALGMKNVTVPGIDMKIFTSDENYANVERFRAAAEKFGMTLSFHNHYHEFEKENGRYKLDLFYEAIPRLGVELDTYWAAYGGVDPIAYMEKYASRLCSIHIKDMKKDPAQRGVNANIGEGCLDIASYLKKADEIGFGWAFVEMDTADGDSLECAKISRENLKKMGY